MGLLGDMGHGLAGGGGIMAAEMTANALGAAVPQLSSLWVKGALNLGVGTLISRKTRGVFSAAGTGWAINGAVGLIVAALGAFSPAGMSRRFDTDFGG